MRRAPCATAILGEPVTRSAVGDVALALAIGNGIGIETDGIIAASPPRPGS